MVPRYSRPEMDAIWAPENRYRIWFEIEALAAEGMARNRRHPRSRRPGHPREGRRPDRPHQRRRGRPHRRHRARDPPRRHRLPDLARRIDRPQLALRPPGHDKLRRAGHLPLGPVDPGHRPAAGRPRPRAGRAENPRVRAQDNAHHRPQPRHPRRAHHVRPEARRPLRRVRPRPRPPGRRAGRNRGRRRSPARSAHSRIWTRAWRRSSPNASVWPPSRSPPRSSRATATPPISAPSA